MKTLVQLKCKKGTPAELLGPVFAECGFDYELLSNELIVYVPNELLQELDGYLEFVQKFYGFSFDRVNSTVKV